MNSEFLPQKGTKNPPANEASEALIRARETSANRETFLRLFAANNALVNSSGQND